MALVHDELVDLHEGARVEQEVEPLARGPLPGLVLAADALLAPGELCLSVAPPKLVELILRHQAPSFIDFRSVFHQ